MRLLQVDLSSAVECLNKGMVASASDGASGYVCPTLYPSVSNIHRCVSNTFPRLWSVSTRAWSRPHPTARPGTCVQHYVCVSNTGH